MTDPLVEIIKHGELMLAVYQDVAQPGMRKVGKALETTLGLGYTCLLPIRLVNELAQFQFTRFMDNYKKRLDNIPEEEIVDVLPEIALPILEKSTYTSNEEIAGLFVNLLKTASSSKTEGMAHPSYIHMISNISSDEAKIVNHLRKILMPIPIPLPEPHKQNLIPYIDVNLTKKGGGHVRFKHLLTGIEFVLDLDFPKNMTAYMENLISLDILTIEHGKWFTDKEIYSDIEKLYGNELKIVTIDTDGRKTSPGILRITKHGENFIMACTEMSN